MSLLLDALKRAEQAKLARQAEESQARELAATTTQSAPLEIIPAAEPPTTLELVGEKLAEAPAPAAPLAAPVSGAILPAAREAAEREAARNVFSAKQPARARKAWPWIALALVPIAGGAAYVWWQLNKLGAPAPVIARNASPVPITPAPAAAAPVLPPAKSATGQLEPPPGGSLPKPVTPQSDVPLPSRVASARSGDSARESLLRSLREPGPVKDAPVALKLSRDIVPSRVSPDLASGYSALQAGDNASARKYYATALQTEPMNPDAHLGLATALARAGDAQGAAQEYRKTLEIDPRNSTGLAGLIAVSGQFNSGALETELRTMLAKNPNSAQLSFSLGNLYLSQSRWNDAQQAFFEAFRVEPDNAEYVYNLAVSLDHLGQSRIALDYYQRALAAGAKSGAQFDRAQVDRRIAELKSLN